MFMEIITSDIVCESITNKDKATIPKTSGSTRRKQAKDIGEVLLPPGKTTIEVVAFEQL